jgi:hypothetical protein
MATVAAAESIAGGRLTVVKWTALAAGDTITPYRPTHKFSDVTVYFFGTFGGNMSLTGTPDKAFTAANFTVLHDALTGALISTISATAVRAVLDSAVAYAPAAAAGVSATDCWLVFRNQ